jgi:hypothetical protein
MRIFYLILVVLVIVSFLGCQNNEFNSEEIDLECPSGVVNDAFPGQCALYTDNNNNEICDYSE